MRAVSLGRVQYDERSMAKDYIELSEGNYYIAGTRVSLDYASALR